MTYNYETEKHKIFTEEGQERFITIRDHVLRLLNQSGAVTMEKAMKPLTGDSWEIMAHIDRMVEIGDIYEITKDMKVAGQYRVFMRAFK